MDVMEADRVRLTFGNGRREEAPLPAAVRQFMDRFNRGDYPDLELAREAM
jgi:hypothetical protein